MGVPTKYRPGLRGPCNAEPPQIKYKHSQSQETPTNQQRKLNKGDVELLVLTTAGGVSRCSLRRFQRWNTRQSGQFY